MQMDDADVALNDINDRIRVARDTLLNMNSLHLFQIPSPIGCDLKVLFTIASVFS